MPLLMMVGGAGARPARLVERGSQPAAPKRSTATTMPLRVILESKHGGRWANCLFSTVELPERAQVGVPLRSEFQAGEPIWGRCYLPDRMGANRPGDLVDTITIDGKLAWKQAYDRAVPADALARLTPYGEVLRTQLAALSPGAHRIEVDGMRGRRRLYHGDFRYVR